VMTINEQESWWLECVFCREPAMIVTWGSSVCGNGQCAIMAHNVLIKEIASVVRCENERLVVP
jgi:hypothetical protein